MRCVVFVPGILGSELTNAAGDVVWPPSALQAITRYRGIDKLVDSNLTATGIIESVGPRSVYRSIINDIGKCDYSSGDSSRRFIPYAYDWRRSNADSAERLADVLDAQAGTATDVLLIGHSMGGLVLRYLLESRKFTSRNWFSKISGLITLGTPHLGAPEAMTQLRWVDKKVGIVGSDLKKLANEDDYPSLFQLAPQPHTTFTMPRRRRGSIPARIETFDAELVDTFELNATNIQSARSFWSELGIERRPEHVPYYFFGGGSHNTIVRTEWEAGSRELIAIERDRSGDGTVPLASAVLANVPHGFSTKQHDRIFEDRKLRKALYDMLDAPAGIVPHSATDVPVESVPAIGTSVGRSEYRRQDPIDVAVSYSDLDQASTGEAFCIQPLDPEFGTPDGSPISFNVAFDGVAVSEFSFTIRPELSPGLYELQADFDSDDPEPTRFVVRSDDDD